MVRVSAGLIHDSGECDALDRGGLGHSCLASLLMVNGNAHDLGE